MGASIFPISGYSGSQYDISILIWKVSEQLILYYCLRIVTKHECRPQGIFAHLLLCPLLFLLID